MHTDRTHTAFTLIELLVVLVIIAMLAGLLMPTLGIAMRSAKATSTRALLAKVDGALHLFKQDVGSFPYLAHEADPEPMAENRLAYHLRRTMEPAELSALRQDIAAAGACYEPPYAGNPQPHFIDATQIQQGSTGYGGGKEFMPIVNRMAANRARLAVLSGNPAVTGIAANAGVTLLPQPAASRGWGDDYLANDLPDRQRRGDAIIDAYGMPLVYVCPVVNGQRGCWAVVTSTGAQNTLNFPVDERYYGMTPQGRLATEALDSDIRTTAAPMYVDMFELWSAGPDRRFDPLRSDGDNRDNIAITPYNRQLR